MESRSQLPLAPPPPSLASGKIENYCGDCGVLFESNKSLQVHLTYHKENLLSRWAPTTSAPSQGQGQIPAMTTAPVKMESMSEPPPPSPNSPHYLVQSQFTQNFPHFSQPIHFLPPPQQQNQFSPNQVHQFDEGRLGPRLKKERTSGEQPAEILDLDSNRVHLYNIQQEQQSFYRPYLMTTTQSPLPPPQLPGIGNGWPHVALPSVDTHYSQGPNPYHPQDLYNLNSLPPPPPQNIVYNYVQEPNYGPPPSLADQGVPMNFQAQLQAQPLQPPQRQIDVTSPVPPPKKEVKVNEGEMMRGKGKGGACKRPKAYECTSCSKWFTSSGHLKRHYGTTLHKNSAQQNGSGGTEPAIGPGRGKGKKSKKQKMDAGNSNPIGGIMMGDSNSPRPMVVPPKNIGNGNGLPEEIQPVPMPPQQYAAPPPPPPQQQQPAAYFYLGETPNQLQHHPQFFSHFDGAGGVYNSHPPIPATSIYGNSGYPQFTTVSTTQYVGEGTPGTYRDENGNGVTPHGNGRNSPEPALKKEPTEESPEVGRGVSPHSSTSWLSPCQGETSDTSSGSGNSPSSGNDFETLTELRSVSLEFSGSEASEGKDEQKQLIHCPHCTKTFTRSCYLTQHKNSNHSPEEKHFKCPLCGKKFHLEPALSEHVSKHGGNKPYKCPVEDCPKDFNHKTDLRRHLCLHSGKKPFNCNECGKGFIRKDHMTKHSEIHRKNPLSRSSGAPPPTFGTPPTDGL